ncbi:hypothetical protein J421_3600 [Gemmatirosa kalamazoonensis]|uniref:YtkA-like domain-containing protein n=1 Tax=Gemmatirosa kalamazoonensis TaxID=861299 RepID=W0RL20_9BACT|nr:hypothetical protein [Gemmatirosa kalamazoonensis]AHG91137.1 hypothetical protein J421_3600 [Gemmatirosa kalamazoonensis]
MTNRLPRGGRTLAATILGGALLAACGAAPRADITLRSDHFEFRVSSDPSPPRAREPIIYTVTVLDRNTRQLVDNGEGQIYATSIDRVNKYDSFTPGREAGTYTARLSYTTAGDWALGMRFRPDSTKPLEKVEWTQTVRAERPISERPAH